MAKFLLFFWTLILFPDPNTQIFYACDSCGDKFLDASSLAQHVRIHTAQALVMFQADSDFYQYTAADGDAAATWQPTTEQVIQEAEHVLHAQGGEGDAEEGIVVQTQEEEKGPGLVVDEEGRENGEVEAHLERQDEVKHEGMQCENSG